MALELVLKSLLSSTKFVNSNADDKDWIAVSKLIPGATPKQCAKKWDELRSQNLLIKSNDKISNSSRGTSNLDSIVDFLLLKKESDESQDEVQPFEENENNDDCNVQAVQSTKRTSEQEFSSKPAKIESSTELKKDSTVNKKLKPKPQSPEGPNMVIHVCDESKNLKQDFLCPRDLLVSEMKYFAEYLSLEPQRWEEVDISVHCDVQIFDWLMKYVKRDLSNSADDMIPDLEPNNVISILISSDFLRMDSLVTKCIRYCHENMSAIVSTPCNMNCINDKLVTRISKLFNHTELDAVKDRKDKFRSKLFCKKIEEFVEGSKEGLCSSADNASTLFRCISCKRLLTAKNQTKIPCILNRMNVDSRGEISYCHSRDASWDINDHLVNLKEKLKSWRDVYWSFEGNCAAEIHKPKQLWGSSNTLYCYRCRCYFPCTDLGHCQYHTSQPEYKTKSNHNSVGVYPCCQQKALLYDSIGVLTGCRVKDHLLHPPSSPSTTPNPDNKNEKDHDDDDSSQHGEILLNAVTSDHSIKRKASTNVVNDSTVISDLLAHRDIICVPFQRLASARTSELNIFHKDGSSDVWKSPRLSSQKFSGNAIDKRSVVDHSSTLPPIRRSKTSIQQRIPSSRRKTSILRNDYFDSSDDEEDAEEEFHNIKVHHFRRIKKKVQASVDQQSFKWDPQRSPRWNQDAQREEDSKRMNEVINTMARLRSAANQEKKSKTKEFPGGIFHKLDHHFRVSIQPPVIKNQNSNNQISSGSRTKKSTKS